MGERNGLDNRWCPRCLWLREKCVCKRPTVLTMDGETTTTGDDPIAPAEWAIDIGAGDGWVVRGFMPPEIEDVPPCCPAPTPRAKL